MEKATSRCNNLDLLRCISCIMIIILHTGSFYETETIVVYQKVGIFLSTITRTAVPCFVMLTGAFLLNDQRNKEWSIILPKTWSNIVLPTLLYSCFYVVVSCITYAIGITQNDYFTIIRLALQGYSYPHMWYMYMIIGVYLSIPMIWRIKEQVADKNRIHIIVIVISLILGCVIQATSTLFWMVKFVPYIGYILFADYIYQAMQNKKLNNINIWVTGGVWIICILFLSLGATGLFNLPKYITFNLLPSDPLDPIVVVSSISCFLFFCKINTRNNVYRFSKLTGQIYLIHLLVIQILKVIIQKLNDGILLHPAIGVPLMVLLTVIICVIYSLLIEKGKKLWNNRKKTGA